MHPLGPQAINRIDFNPMRHFYQVVLPIAQTRRSSEVPIRRLMTDVVIFSPNRPGFLKTLVVFR